MPVSDFECQIARGQIGRYLGGGALSPEALKGLEEHLDECPGCKDVVAARRAALLDQLDEPPTHAVVSAPKAEAHPLLAALRARDGAPSANAPKAAPRYAGKRPAAPTKPNLGKPLALAAVLAITLLGMSYLSRAVGGKGALGTKAALAYAPTPTPVVPSPEAVKVPETAPKPVAATPPAKPTPFVKPTVTPASPEPVIKPLALPLKVAPKTDAKPVAAPLSHLPAKPVARATKVPAAPRTVVRRRLVAKAASACAPPSARAAPRRRPGLRSRRSPRSERPLHPCPSKG